jgi:ATP-dependent protease ClpP protease subunit
MTLHYVSFSAEINPSTTEHLINGMANLHNQGATEVHLLFSTPGGSIMNGFNLYNVLRAMPFKLVIHNVGNVDSIGNVIFLAGSERVAAPHSTFMFHGAGFDLNGAFRLTEPVLKDHLDSLLADQKRMASVLEQHTTLTADQAVGLFEHASTKDAAWAENVGMTQATSEPKIPVGAPVHSLVFNR